MRTLALLLVLLALPAAATHEPWSTIQYPQDKDKWWWDDAWWERGRIPVPRNHEVIAREATYRSGEVEVPVGIYRPKQAGAFPVTVFLHGRRGVDELTRLVPLRIAARGFVVVAPDLYAGRFVETFPIRHDYALKALVTKKRQDRTACYVSYYPHWQDPNAPEPMQVYQYAPELDSLSVPVLVFLGEHEQYQRTRSILAGMDALRGRKQEARVIVYPGVGREFEFRPPNARTLADDLAAQDSLPRAAAFMRRHLGAPE